MEQLFESGDTVIPAPEASIPNDVYFVECYENGKVKIKSKTGKSYLIDEDDLYISMME